MTHFRVALIAVHLVVAIAILYFYLDSDIFFGPSDVYLIGFSVALIVSGMTFVLLSRWLAKERERLELKLRLAIAISVLWLIGASAYFAIYQIETNLRSYHSSKNYVVNELTAMVERALDSGSCESSDDWLIALPHERTTEQIIAALEQRRDREEILLAAVKRLDAQTANEGDWINDCLLVIRDLNRVRFAKVEELAGSLAEQPEFHVLNAGIFSAMVSFSCLALFWLVTFLIYGAIRWVIRG